MQFRALHLWTAAGALLLQAGLCSGVDAQSAIERQLSTISGITSITSAAALTGTVSSQEEGNMEGVLVNAKKEGSNITITVVSDDKGVYSFPADRLAPGKYTISIRAAGYVLGGPRNA